MISIFWWRATVDLLCRLHTASERYGMHINVDKTKTMVFGSRLEQNDAVVCINRTVLEMWRALYTSAVNLHRIMTAPETFKEYSWQRGLMATFILYGKTKDSAPRQRFSCYRRASLRYYYMQQKCGPRRKMISIDRWHLKCSVIETYWKSTGRTTSQTMMSDGKCSWSGHWWTPFDRESFSCSAISAECQTLNCYKSLVFGMVEGKRRPGRPVRRWIEDNLMWCGQDVQKALMMPMDRDNWRRLMASPYGPCWPREWRRGGVLLKWILLTTVNGLLFRSVAVNEHT